MPRQLILTCLLTLTLVSVSPRPSSACSCAGSDIVLRFQNSPWVFTGTVTTVDNEASREEVVRVSISFDEIFRSPEGIEVPASFTVDRPEEGGNCRLDLPDGSQWVFFLRDLGSWPSVCDQNLALSGGRMPFWAETLPPLFRSGVLQDGARVFPWRFIGAYADHCHLQIEFHQPSSGTRTDNGVLTFHEGRFDSLGSTFRFHYSDEFEVPPGEQRGWLTVGDRTLRVSRRRGPEDRFWSAWELDEGDPHLLLLHFQAARIGGFEIEIEGEGVFGFEDLLRAEAFERFEACRDSLPPEKLDR